VNPKLLKKQVNSVETRLLQTTVWIVEFVIQNQHYLFRLKFWLEFLKILPASYNGQQEKLLSINRTDTHHQNSLLKKADDSRILEEFWSEKQLVQAAQNCTIWLELDDSFNYIHRHVFRPYRTHQCGSKKLSAVTSVHLTELK
jgi:hypothetical protein